ncbi:MULTISPECIES: division plane positioning ATPase MipZ [Aeromonas]|jgi:chromosome partitioning protein|uniref:division plane positioning ATPase MipZ n=1 Tax=Aeromonas TaxID=642 RepID=UPI001117E694|nr:MULTISPECIES: division plane positioning ATPase MipZ [Aeromonas]MBA2084188.1 cobyrinic acid ac-diamide synthase [Aeromonas veronii]TNJ25513.1 cobyrinic acid ac-diamide synthase [Aeromonas sobria]UJQ39330.1 AAA family ATPase [Aeromonas caviae]
MIILIGSQKGGCGKSTVAVNICAALAKTGRDVVLVDADRQCTSTNWTMDRAVKPNLNTVHSVQKYENIRETLLDLSQRYEFVIVDAAGRDSRELRTGMIAADILLVPFRPSQPDLDTLQNLQQIIIQAKDLNPKLIVYGVLTMAPTNPSIHESDEARDYLLDYPEIMLLKTTIRDRKIYRDAMSEGLGVVEMDNKKATDEITSLMQEIISW